MYAMDNNKRNQSSFVFKRFVIGIILIAVYGCGGNLPIQPDRVTPQAGSGAIIGTVDNVDDYWPDRTVSVYAAEFYGDSASEGVFLLEPQQFPKAELNEDHTFVLTDMPPKAYVLLIGTNAETAIFLVRNGEKLIVEVVGDRVMELGDVQASE
jgi:hypothetical protein